MILLVMLQMKWLWNRAYLFYFNIISENLLHFVLRNTFPLYISNDTINPFSFFFFLAKEIFPILFIELLELDQMPNILAAYVNNDVE